jgi:hypothetical protein
VLCDHADVGLVRICGGANTAPPFRSKFECPSSPVNQPVTGARKGIKGCLKSPANAKFTERAIGLIPALRKLG